MAIKNYVSELDIVKSIKANTPFYEIKYKEFGRSDYQLAFGSFELELVKYCMSNFFSLCSEVYEIRCVCREMNKNFNGKMYHGIAALYSRGDLMFTFDSFEKAMSTMKRLDLHSQYRLVDLNNSQYYLINEYIIERNIYDADGNWISGGEIMEYSDYRSKKNER